MKFKSLWIVLVILMISNVFSQLKSPDNSVMRQQITGDNAQKIIRSAEKIIIGSNGSVAVIEISDKINISTENFITDNLNNLGLSGESQLKKIRENTDKLGMVHKRYKQFYKNYEIPAAEYIFHEKKGRLIRANGIIIPGLKINTDIRISEKAALNIAVREVNAQEYMWETDEINAGQYYPKSKLVISSRKYSLEKEEMRLVYQFDIYAKKPVARYNVEVDANTGEVINIFNKIHTADVRGSGSSMYNGTVPMTVDSLSASSYRLREISRGDGVETYNLHNGTTYSSAIDFTDTDKFFNTDGAAVNAHWGAERTYDYFLNVHGRNSFDDSGAKIKSYVHYGYNFFNAFWDGYVMTYGDGDGTTATALVSLDIIGHEITHAVTEHTADLIYSYESGAINESFSDLFGQSIEFHNNDSTASWNLADEIYLDGVSMIRCMSNPNLKGDPDTYLGTNWVTGSSDNGGVHTNSGVQNFWYYLLVDGGTGTNDNGYNYNVSGIGLESAEQIAYRNLSIYLTPSSQYIDTRAGSEQAAIDLFGAGSAEYNSVVAAWNAVGVPSATPQLNVVQTSLNFGSFVVGYTDSLIVEIQNLGTGILNIDSVYTTSDQFTINNTNIAVSTNSSYELAVSFCPDALGSFTDTLIVVYGIDKQRVVLHGFGQEEPEIDVNPTNFTFTLNEGDSTNCSFDITNTGDGDLYFQIISSPIVEAVARFNQRSKANFEKKAGVSVDGKLSTLESSFFARTYLNLDKATSGTGNVLIIGSESDSMYFGDIKNYLISSGEFASITFFNAKYATPTLEEMQFFDAVLVYSWYSFYDQNSLGDNLADFVDNKGNLLVAFGANITDYFNIGGRFDTDNYWLIEKADYSGGYEINLGTVRNSTHPIMKGISEISVYSSLESSTVNEGAEVLADLDNGFPLIAVKDTNCKRVDLTIPLKTLAYTDWGIDTATDADELIVNAVKWMVGESGLITVDVQEDTLSTSQTVTVNAKVKAGDLLGGHYESSLSVMSNDLDESEVKINFDLTIIGVPNISIQDSIDFNTVFAGVAASRTVVFNNTGSDQINVSSVDFGKTEFAIDTAVFSIPPKSSVDRTIMFNSPVAGAFTSTMTVSSNDPDEPARTVILRAEAVDPPIIGVNPTFFDITLNSGDSTVQTLTISNTGGSDLNWDLSIENNSKQYLLTKPKSGTFRTEVKTVSVDASRKKSLAADLNDLTGIRILYDLDIADYSTLYSDLVLRGAAFTLLTHPLTVMSAYDIFITDDFNYSSWTSSEYTLLHDWIEAGGSMMIGGDDNLTHYNALIPAGSGITMNANDDYLYPVPVVYPHEITESVSSVDAESAGSWLTLVSPAVKILEYAGGTSSDGKALMAVSTSGSGRIAVFGNESFSDYSFAYGTDNQLLANQTFDWLAGSSELDTDIESGTIYAGSSQDVLITVQTKDMNAGEYNYNIKIGSNDPVNPEVDVPFDLTIVGVPNISIQDSVDFNQVFTGVISNSTLAVNNVGTDTLKISSVDFGMTEFSIDSAAFTVPPRSSVDRTIMFNTLTVGTFVSTLTVNSNDPDEPVRTVVLRAEAVNPPVIGVNPTFFDITLNSGDSTSANLTITNNNSYDLTYYLSVVDTKGEFKSKTVIEETGGFITVGKETLKEFKIVNPLSGEDDGYGYKWRDSDELNGPDFTWNDITAVGTRVSLSDDSNSGLKPLGFGFRFYDKVYSNITICSNGWLSFTNVSGNIFNAPLPSTSMPENVIAWMAYDLYPGAGSCYYYYDSSNHRFIVQFNNWTDYSTGTGQYTAQIIINENGKILLQYKTIINAVRGAVGIQNSDRTSGMTISYYDASFFKDQYAVEIFYTSYWLSISDESLIVSAGNSENVTLNISALDLSSGNYESNISIVPEDHPQYTKNVPVNLTVIGAPNISIQDSVDFNQVFTGVTDSIKIIVNNTGIDALNISSVNFSVPEFSIDLTSFTIPPKNSVDRTIMFNSSIAGSFTSTMTVNSNDPDEPAKTVILRAEAVDPPIIGVNPTFFDITLNSGDSTVQTLTISNTGGSDLDWSIGISESEGVMKTTSLYDQYKNFTSYKISSDNNNSGEGKVAPIPIDKIQELKGDIQILAWTTYADMTREYPNTMNAISQYFTDYTVTTTTITDPSALNIALSGKDVFLIPEQEGGSPSVFTSLGSAWATTLTNFVNNGGTVIFCGSYGIWYPAHEILNTSGLMTMSYNYCYNSGTMAVDTSHFITSGVPAFIPAQDATYFYNVTDPSAVDLVTMYGYKSIAVKEIGMGHVVLIGYDYYNYDDNAAILISNAVKWSDGCSELDPDLTSGTIYAGSSQDVLIAVQTLDMNAGEYNYNIKIGSNDPVNPQVDVPFDLTVIGVPNISIQDFVDFNKVFTGVISSLSLAVNNVGTDTLKISSVDFGMTEFAIDLTSFSIPPKSSVDRTITFNSSIEGTFVSTMTVNSNDSDEPSRIVVLTADAVDPPIIGVNPTFFDITLNSGDSAVQTLTISNTGSSDLDWSIDTFKAKGVKKTSSLYDRYKDSKYHAVSSDKNNFGSGKVDQIPVEKNGDMKGDIKILAWTTYADMSIEYPNTINAISQYFTGYTVSTTVTTDPAKLNSELSDKDIFLIPKQEGGSPSIFNSLGSSWAEALTNFVNKGGTIILCGSGSPYFTHEILNTNGLMIMTYSAAFQYGTMAVDTNYFITSGVPASIPVQNATILYNVTDTSASKLVTMYGSTAIATKEIGRGKVVVLGYDFQNYDNNASKLISNAVKWSGRYTELDTDLTSGTIYAGASQDVLITVQAKDMNAGEYNYNINIVSNDPVRPEVAIPFDLKVIGFPNISFQDSVEFSTVITTATASRTLVVNNVGTDTLNISSVDFGMAEFAIDRAVFSVPPRSSINRTITFSSSTAGAFVSTMTVNSNDPDEPSKVVVLTAKAVDPPKIGVSPEYFDITLNSGDSVFQTLTISNKGGIDLNWSIDISRVGSKVKTTSRYDHYKDLSCYGLSSDKNNLSNGEVAPIPVKKIEDLKGGIQILAWTTYADMTRKYPNTMSAISQYFTDYTVSTTTTKDPSALNIALSGKDVFLIPGQDGGSSSIFTSLGKSWATTLANFVNNGGTVILCGSYYSAHEIINNSGLMAIPFYTQSTSGTMAVDTAHFITSGVPSFIPAQNATILYNVADPSAVDLVKMYGYTAVAAKRIGCGNVVMIGYDFQNYDDNAAKIISNAVQWAEIYSDVSSGTICAGLTQDILITFSSTDMNAGEYNYNIKIGSNDPVRPEVDVPFDLTVIGVPNIDVQDTLDFNTVFTEAANSRKISINNTGTDVLNINSVDFGKMEFSIDRAAFSVPPKSSVERTIMFNSTIAGVFTSTMTVNSDDPDEPAGIVILTAEAVSPPIIGVSPEYFDITLNSGDSTVQTLTISNTGGSDLNWSIDISESESLIKTSLLYDRYKDLTYYAVSTDNNNSGEGKVAPIPIDKIQELNGDIQILAWTKYADMSIEYPNTLNAISQYFTDYTVSTTITTDPAILNSELSDKDVFLIPEQEGGSVSIFSSLGNSWATTLTNFVNKGGTVILCGSGITYSAHEILNTCGLMIMTYYGVFQYGMMAVDTNHFITSGVPASIPVQNVTTLYNVADPSAVELVTMYGYTAVAAKKIGLGHVVMLGYDYFDYDDNTAKLISNAVQWGGALEIYSDITSGTIYAGSSQDVTTTVYATGKEAGEQNYNINITSNDPAKPKVDVPIKVVITSSIPDNWSALIPKQYELKQNYPNPFNPLTTIEYGLPEQSVVTIDIYNLSGQKVEKLFDNKIQQAGYHKVVWNTKQLSCGIYFYRINAVGNKKFSCVKKMILQE